MLRPLLVTAAIAAVGIGVAPLAGADPYDVLWKMVPPGYSQGSCEAARPGDNLEPGATAFVECRNNSLPGGPPVARYVLFSDVNGLNSHFTDDFQSHHFQATLCPGMPGFPIRWNRPDGTEAGTVACGNTEGDESVVLWTDDSGPMIAWAQGPDLTALFKWWSTVVQPG